ncbi:MAG: DUF1570 domain-containing protein [Novipirellula sp. JB048]
MAALRSRVLSLTLLASLIGGGENEAAGQIGGLIEFSAAGRLQRGLPLASLAEQIVVIGRDGGLHSLDPRQPETQLRSLAGDYQPLSARELRGQLQAEFGNEFEVVTTANFLVVQPRGRGERWARLFEQSHRGFIAYMSKRGVQVRQGRFPMVAIVLPDSASMYEEFEKQNLDVPRVAGIYSNNSNRVITHDSGHFDLIAATVRHEAAHQSAFNSGVHSRLNETPKWITEGIGQLFEPAAVTHRHTAGQRRERVNRESLRILRSSYGDENQTGWNQAIFDLISSDAMFDDEKQVQNAYAVAWAMMFYLAERQPQQFAAILDHTATRPPFARYGRHERRDDFERLIGVDAAEFSRRVGRFLDSL